MGTNNTETARGCLTQPEAAIALREYYDTMHNRTQQARLAASYRMHGDTEKADSLKLTEPRPQKVYLAFFYELNGDYIGCASTLDQFYEMDEQVKAGKIRMRFQRYKC